MQTCPKLNGARVPKQLSVDDLLRVKADLYEITAIPGTKIQYPNVNSGAAWMANTDLDENGTKGVWHDYYTKEPVGQDLLDAVIGTLEPSCAVNLEVVTEMFMKYFWLARELQHLSPKKYQSIYMEVFVETNSFQ